VVARPEDPNPNFHVVIRGLMGWLTPLLAELSVRTLLEVWTVEPSQVRVRTALVGTGKLVTRLSARCHPASCRSDPLTEEGLRSQGSIGCPGWVAFFAS
jgi:hypothetical protein